MIKIGLLVYGLDRPMTGISRYMVELVRALGQLTPRPNITLLAAGAVALDVPFPVVTLPFCRLLPQLLTVGQVALRRAVYQHQLTVVHDLSGVTPFELLPSHVQKVVTIQDVFALSIPGYSSRLDALIYRRWLPMVLRRVDHVVTSSEHSRCEIVRWMGVSAENITPIPLGIHPQFAPKSPNPSTPPYILFVGNLTERKNLRRALEAFALIAPRFPALRFCLVGPRTWRQTPIETVVTRLGIENRVDLLGSVPNEQLPQLYSDAQLLLFPSLYEGFGLPVIEAMACGTPVITSNVSSLPEVAGEAAVQVDPTNVAEIAQAVQQVLESADYRQMLIARGLKRSIQFTWLETAKRTVALYGR
ncbi:MAG: glycosyltransferase family 4 protein [Candidatus Promineifilaceae bacterium]